MIYDLQLQWIRDLHQYLRSPWMDRFFIAWNYVDTFYFTLIANVLIWYLWDRRIGIRIFYILMLSFAVNQTLKVLFSLPRPCQIDPTVGLLCHTSFGFPSGAAQSAAIFGGVIVLEARKNLYRVLGVLFALMLCFSRVYLGVHYPTDILGGLAVGCLLLFVYKKVFPLFEKSWQWAAVYFPFFLLIPTHFLSWDMFWFYSTLGLACGFLTEIKQAKTDIRESLAMRFSQAFTVIGGILLLIVLGKYFSKLEIFWWFLEGYWLSFLGAYLARKCKK